MKKGDLVRIVGMPPGLTDDPSGLETRTVFERSVGLVFPIADITEYGHIELEVGEVMGLESYLHSIWIEPEYLEAVGNSD